MTERRITTANRRLAKKRVQCLNEALCPDNYRDFVLADNLVLRNPLLRQGPKRYGNTNRPTVQQLTNDTK